MFKVFIVARRMHQQVTKYLQIRKKYNYYCLEYTHIDINTVLEEGYIMGRDMHHLAYITILIRVSRYDI